MVSDRSRRWGLNNSRSLTSGEIRATGEKMISAEKIENMFFDELSRPDDFEPHSPRTLAEKAIASLRQGETDDAKKYFVAAISARAYSRNAVEIDGYRSAWDTAYAARELAEKEFYGD